MNQLEERIQTLEYYQQLFLQMIEGGAYPFYHLVIKKNVTKSEVEQLFSLCEDLEEELGKQRAQGYVVFTSLLTLFEKQLPTALPVDETMNSLKDQGLFVDLMTELMKWKHQ
ncbi:DUF1878 family protein [Bacillus carboniphilus]|uniref:DUF1878 family protein n=1 Tax=Bacillus carboniphilus TaxID=86663 RepID=A0ABY9JWN6_9BACI|nr:DUF1878 family protein [Bacillus carboniphilus]WLR42840.1 DUF1878 family protein [Bacillus carboniphilus]